MVNLPVALHDTDPSVQRQLRVPEKPSRVFMEREECWLRRQILLAPKLLFERGPGTSIF